MNGLITIFIMFIILIIYMMYINVRNRNVYTLSIELIHAISNYSINHIINNSGNYDTIINIDNVDNLIPSYDKMLFIPKRLTYKNWLDKDVLLKLTPFLDVNIKSKYSKFLDKNEDYTYLFITLVYATVPLLLLSTSVVLQIILASLNLGFALLSLIIVIFGNKES